MGTHPHARELLLTGWIVGASVSQGHICPTLPPAPTSPLCSPYKQDTKQLLISVQQGLQIGQGKQWQSGSSDWMQGYHGLFDALVSTETHLCDADILNAAELSFFHPCMTAGHWALRTRSCTPTFSTPPLCDAGRHPRRTSSSSRARSCTPTSTAPLG